MPSFNRPAALPPQTGAHALDHDDDHDLGLQHDLSVLIRRRHVLTMLGATGLLAACGDGTGFGSAKATELGTAADGSQCVLPAEETAGPFPADGSNSANGERANVLSESGVIREDIRRSFGMLSGEAGGVPLSLTLRLESISAGCAPLEGYVMYIWHCDAAGRYSIYNLPRQNYLRGVGRSDSDGQIRFTTIFPGCYRGRYPHIHFELYRSLDEAQSYRNKILTSQFALPADACDAVYDAGGVYAASRPNFEGTSLARDGVFRDNTAQQMQAVTLKIGGDAATGMTGETRIGLKV